MQLAVELDRDEVGVEQTGDGRVAKALPLHDVAPVAGEVTAGDEQGPALGACLGEDLRPPGAPGHRVLAMQGEVGRGIARQGVGSCRRLGGGWRPANLAGLFRGRVSS